MGTISFYLLILFNEEMFKPRMIIRQFRFLWTRKKYIFAVLI